MKQKMRQWINDILSSNVRRAFPLMACTGIELTRVSINDMLQSGKLQAECVKALAVRYPSLASILAMDLSVEAEAFGSEIRCMENDTPTITESIVKDSESANALIVPAIGSKRTGAFLEAAALLAEGVTDRPVFGSHIGPFSLACRLCGMTEALMNVHAEPETLHIVLRKTTEFLVDYAQAFREAGIGGIVIAEPAAGLISPTHCDEFSSRYVKAIIDAVQDDDFMIILHNCASASRHVETMVSTGAMGVHFGNAVDMEQVLKIVPPCIPVFGNIDPAAVLKNGTEEEICRTTKNLLLKTSGYANFVLSSGCDVPPGTPLRNIDVFFRALNEYNAEK
jgi:uroporphyrinogen decarboxylase